mgnify:CR=1 FL=1
MTDYDAIRNALKDASNNQEIRVILIQADGTVDLTLEGLRDALRGADDRTLTDLYNKHLHPVVAEAYEVDVSTEDYSVTINKGNYKFTQVDVKVTASTTIIVEYSYNNSNWWTYYESPSAETEYHETFNLAAPYVKVTVKAVSGGEANICVGAVP